MMEGGGEGRRVCVGLGTSRGRKALRWFDAIKVDAVIMCWRGSTSL